VRGFYGLGRSFGCDKTPHRNAAVKHSHALRK
jgi:hypothetical protein